LTPDINLGIDIHVDNPHFVGADRLADAIAAGALHGGPAVIIDFGTATTVDAIDGSGAYLGGAIAPGLEASHDALVRRAALLPRIPLIPPEKVIGKDVVSSMQAGLLIGYAAMIEGLATRAVAELGGTAHVIATGGLATVVSELSDVIEQVDPDLTLHGIRIAHERHVGS
jgi:type III pantothenate kinase